MKLAASTIAALYKGRWEIEKFFRWIKQNLKNQDFHWKLAENSVMTQVWVALILYLLLSFIKYQTRFKASITELLRIIREVLLNKVNLIEYLRTTWEKLYGKSKATRAIILFVNNLSRTGLIWFINPVPWKIFQTFPIASILEFGCIA